MKFSQLIHTRYSVRSYAEKPVEKEKLVQVLEAARMAPSAVNFQPWHFIVITQSSSLGKLHQAYQRDWFRAAPVVIVACVDHSLSWKRNIDGKDFADIDVAIAVDHLILQATELGLGCCWVCNFDAQKCAELLQLPGTIEPVVMIPVGYPAEDEEPKEKKRKLFEDIIHWEAF